MVWSCVLWFLIMNCSFSWNFTCKHFWGLDKGRISWEVCRCFGQELGTQLGSLWSPLWVTELAWGLYSGYRFEGSCPLFTQTVMDWPAAPFCGWGCVSHSLHTQVIARWAPGQMWASPVGLSTLVGPHLSLLMPGFSSRGQSFKWASQLGTPSMPRAFAVSYFWPLWLPCCVSAQRCF